MTDCDENICSICIDSIDEKFYKTKCNHKFHFSCLENWLKKSNQCPNCRETILTEKKKFPEYEIAILTNVIPNENLIYHENNPITNNHIIQTFSTALIGGNISEYRPSYTIRRNMRLFEYDNNNFIRPLRVQIPHRSNLANQLSSNLNFEDQY